MTVVILTVMITPIMIALICEALASVPISWREGAVALGLNPLRAILAVTLRAIRPAIVAAAVLATARALGEAIMIQMVSGGRSFAPKPVDGVIFLFEPLRTLASSIVDYHEGISAPALRSTLYAFALLLLFAAFALSVMGYLVKLPLRKLPGPRMSAFAPDAAAAAGSSPGSLRRRAGAAGAPRRGAGGGATGSCWPCAWIAGIGLCLIAAAIVVYMGYRGIEYLRPGLLVQPPAGEHAARRARAASSTR